MDSRGVSEVVGEIMLMAIITVVMAMIATSVASNYPGRALCVDLWVRLENTSDSRRIRIEIMNAGGDDIPEVDEGLIVSVAPVGRAAAELTPAIAENFEYTTPTMLRFAENISCYVAFDKPVKVGDVFIVTIVYDKPPYEPKILLLLKVSVAESGDFYPHNNRWYFNEAPVGPVVV